MMQTYNTDTLLKTIDRYKELVKKNRKNGGLNLTDHKEYLSLEDYIKSHILDAIKDGYSLSYVPSKHYVFEFNDKFDSRTWHILCFDGENKYACKSFSCNNSYSSDAYDYVEEFLKDGGNHYKYELPWDIYCAINKEDYDGVYVLPDKPLNNLEGFRVYPKTVQREVDMER